MTQKYMSRLKFHTYVSATAFVVSILYFSIFLIVPPNDWTCIRAFTTYSPAEDAIHYESIHFGDQFYPPSIYRGLSTPERDEAWNRLMSHRMIGIPEDKLDLLNQSNTQTWKRLSDGHIAAVLGMHYQMNCLNLLRLYAHLDLDNALQTEIRKDADSCIQLLRHQILCAEDTTPFLELVMPWKNAGSAPDLRTMHKCRRYDTFGEWMDREGMLEEFYSIWESTLLRVPK